jgi:hypothetical protein
LRKPRRFCPAAPGDICTVCCGTKREQTLDCPVDCEHLLEAHRHEKRQDPPPDSVPNQDITVSEDFLREHEWVFIALLAAVAQVARKHTAVNDWDAREALEGLIRTYRTLGSGLYYESRPVNPRAAEIFAAVQATVADVRKRETEARGMSTLRDATVMGILVFLERLERVHNNGRARSRAFLASLCEFGPGGGKVDEPVPAEEPRLIL